MMITDSAATGPVTVTIMELPPEPQTPTAHEALAAEAKTRRGYVLGKFGPQKAIERIELTLDEVDALVGEHVAERKRADEERAEREKVEREWNDLRRRYDLAVEGAIELGRLVNEAQTKFHDKAWQLLATQEKLAKLREAVAEAQQRLASTRGARSGLVVKAFTLTIADHLLAALDATDTPATARRDLEG